MTRGQRKKMKRLRRIVMRQPGEGMGFNGFKSFSPIVILKR